MKELMNYISDYLKGNSLYSPVTKFLNFYLSAGITSFIFKKFYFNYTLLDLSDYKGIYNYFINGDFIVPLILFAIIHYGLNFLAEAIFLLATFKKSSRWAAWITKQRIKKRDHALFFKALNKNPIITMPIKLDKTLILKYFDQIKKSIPADEWEKAKGVVDKKKEEIANNFKLTIKAMVALTIYFNSVSYFGLLLYSCSILILLISLFFFFYTWLILDISPLILKKIDSEITKMLLEVESSLDPC